MKKAVFFVLVLFTCYLAGMYRSLPLMTLGVMELMLMVLLFIQPRCFKKKMSVAFLKAGESTEEGRGTLCRIRVQNRSRLPVNHFKVSLHIRYPQDFRSVRKELRGIAEQGENNVEFEIYARYCGLIQIRMNRLRVADYLGLFSSGKPLTEEMRIAVFPKEQAFDIRLSASDSEQGSRTEQWTVNRQGDAYDEIRKIREYQSGDSMRHIHWNHSAKTEELWFKEYEREIDSLVNILVDSTGFSLASAMELNAFYKALSALMLGLLRDVAAVRVHWYHSDRGGLMYLDGSDAEQCRDILLQLYQTDFSNVGGLSTSQMSDCSGKFYQQTLRLTLELSLYRGDVFVCRFSREKLDSQIREEILVL